MQQNRYFPLKSMFFLILLSLIGRPSVNAQGAAPSEHLNFYFPSGRRVNAGQTAAQSCFPHTIDSEKANALPFFGGERNIPENMNLIRRFQQGFPRISESFDKTIPHRKIIVDFGVEYQIHIFDINDVGIIFHSEFSLNRFLQMVKKRSKSA